MNHYAVGLKGWVEVVRSAAPPKKNVSEMKVKAQAWGRKWIDDPGSWNGGFWEEVLVPKTRAIQVVSYKGGRVIARLRTAQVRKKLGITVGAGAMTPLSAEQVAILLETKKRIDKLR